MRMKYQCSALMVVFTLSLTLCEGTSTADNWPQVQKNPQHHGYTDDPALPPYKPLWKTHFGYERIGRCTSAVIADGRVFVGTKHGVIHAVSLAKGKELWAYRADGPILHSAAVAEGKVIFASLDGNIYALKAEDGKKLWTFNSGFGFSNAPVILDDRILIGNRKGDFFCLNVSDGKELWHKNLAAPVFQTAAANQGKVYVGSEDMYMHALSIKDGSELWKSEKLQGQSFKDYWPVVHKGYVIVRPMVVAIEWLKVRDVKPFGWSTDAELLNEAYECYPNGKLLPKPFMDAQDKLVQYFRENPDYREVYFLNESDGKIGFISPLIHASTLGGAVAPPAVIQNDLLAVPLMADSCRWGAFDIEKQCIVDIWPHRQGNPDETHISTSAGPIVFIMHGREGWATGTFDMQNRKRVNLPTIHGPQSPFYDNLVNGASPAIISEETIVHVACSTVRAWKAQGESE